MTSPDDVLIQAPARGLLSGDLEAMRALVRSTKGIRCYEPRSSIARQRA
jgi:hypothetical protein